jgi:hypothetical protein
MNNIILNAFADELEKCAAPSDAARVGKGITDVLGWIARAGRYVAPMTLLPAAGAIAGYKASEHSPAAGAAVGGLGALAALINLRGGRALPIAERMTRPKAHRLGQASDLERIEANALRYGLGEYFMYPGMALGAAAGASFPKTEEARRERLARRIAELSAEMQGGPEEGLPE